MTHLTHCTPAPLTLLDLSFFLELLTGDWTEEDLLRQHDTLDFSIFLLGLLKPKFLHCAWAPLPVFTGTCEDTHLRDEKGTSHMAIRLPLSLIPTDACTLKDLVNVWHDPLGLCRALTQVGQGLCLALERSLTLGQAKLQTQVQIPDTVRFPYFADLSGNVAHATYEIVAVAYHIGPQITSGHYRAALKTTAGWLNYDDGRLPEKINSLTPCIQSQVVFIWLTRSLLHDGYPPAAHSHMV